MKVLTDHQLGTLFVATSALAWSTAGFFTRLIALDSFTMLVWRGLFGALGLLIVIIVMQGRNWAEEFRRMGRPEWINVGLVVAGMILFITSLGNTSVAHNAVIYATIPFLSALLGWLLLRERPTRPAMIASGVALTGVIILAGFGTDGHWFGDLLGFLMTLTMAFSIILMRHHPNLAIAPSACLGSLIGAIVCLPFADPLVVTGPQIAYLAMFGVANSALGLALFSVGSKKLPAIESALIGSLDAPLAPFWVWLAFRETPSFSTILGGAIVFCAVLGHIISSQKKPVPGAMP